MLDELQISKGPFYHYFDSKSDLLEALIERMRQDVEPIILPILNDPDLPTFDKLHRFFDTAARAGSSSRGNAIPSWPTG